MALYTEHGGIKFGVGDKIKITARVKEGDKLRAQVFEGQVISIKGSKEERTFTVRKIGAGGVGIERIFSLTSPAVGKVELVRSGVKGVTRAKLYYTREKSPREIEKIFARAARRTESQKKVKPKKPAKKKRASKK